MLISFVAEVFLLFFFFPPSGICKLLFLRNTTGLAEKLACYTLFLLPTCNLHAPLLLALKIEALGASILYSEQVDVQIAGEL